MVDSSFYSAELRIFHGKYLLLVTWKKQSCTACQLQYCEVSLFVNSRSNLTLKFIKIEHLTTGTNEKPNKRTKWDDKLENKISCSHIDIIFLHFFDNRNFPNLLLKGTVPWSLIPVCLSYSWKQAFLHISDNASSAMSSQLLYRLSEQKLTLT